MRRAEPPEKPFAALSFPFEPNLRGWVKRRGSKMLVERLLLTLGVVLCLKCSPSDGLYEKCNHLVTLKANEKIYINSPYYPKPYPRGTSCRYTVDAPVDYELSFKCNISLSAPSKRKCGSEIFYFNREASELLSGSDYFCGSGSLERKSFLNRATISYISSSTNNNTGYFSCLVEAYEPPCDCGWSSTLKVAGGTEAAPGEFPSMAAVVRKTENTIFCGATIIHHRYLLSAAHCFVAPETTLAEQIKIIVGEHDLSAIYNSFYSQEHDIEEIVRHKNFRLTNLRNDIALLRTVKPMAWTRVVGPACLPFRYARKTLAGRRADTAGWGTTSFGGQQSSKLLKTSLDILRNDVCKQSVSAVTAGQFCTSTPGRDTCQYDSGGGLYLRMSRMYAVGVVSYGYACAGEVPSVNSRISTYLKWVQGKARDARFCVK